MDFIRRCAWNLKLAKSYVKCRAQEVMAGVSNFVWLAFTVPVSRYLLAHDASKYIVWGPQMDSYDLVTAKISRVIMHREGKELSATDDFILCSKWLYKDGIDLDSLSMLLNKVTKLEVFYKMRRDTWHALIDLQWGTILYSKNGDPFNTSHSRRFVFNPQRDIF